MTVGVATDSGPPAHWQWPLAAFLFGSLAAAAGLALLAGGAYSQTVALTGQVARTSGVVVDDGFMNHGQFAYRFSVGRIEYSGHSHAGSDGSPATVSIGDSVAVVYQQGHPNNSCACDPQSNLLDAITYGVGAVLIGGLIAASCAALIRRLFR